MMGKNSNKELGIIEISRYGKTKELGRTIGFEGTTEILDLLDDRPRQYKEIDYIIGMPHATLIRRLTMLQILGLVKKKPITSKRRGTHVYDLTRSGMELMKFIKSYEKEVSLPLLQQRIIDIEEK
jgi:DNA-binding HxlR family transcriptional regulator